MCKVLVNDTLFTAEKGEKLKDFFTKHNIKKEHPCAGSGVCKKCLVKVNGREELSCQYTITDDITVEIEKEENILSELNVTPTGEITENMCFCLDLGTTTLALALVSLNNGSVIKVITDTNPQRAYGSDVISRITYCEKNGVEALQTIILKKVDELTSSFNFKDKIPLYVSGNTTMLHFFAGENPVNLGKAPYTPVFLSEKHITGEALGLSCVSEAVLLPSISAFAGADIVAGLNSVSTPPNGKYNILADLGTNAEIILYSKDKIFATSAASGPCFEGANISQGMSASAGAIFEYSFNGSYKTVGDAPATGICATGLIDIIAVLLNSGETDKTGYMGKEKIEVAPGVYLTAEDVRQVQLAKSAVYSGILTLMKLNNVFFEDIDTLYISGGFSAKINKKNAAEIGLIPKELLNKAESIKNSCLSGTVKFATQKNDLSEITEKAVYTDLGTSTVFSELFIENMMF